jgi:signal transduction histidine kinase
VLLPVVAREAIHASGVPAALIVEAEERAQADAQQLQQALVNLLQNARDALHGANLEVEGRLRLRVAPGALLRVEDDGPGVSAEVLERLFEPFVTTKTRGTGLGLAISKKIVAGMGGSLSLEGCGPGAVFCLKLELSGTTGGQTSPADSAGRSG